MNVVKPIQPFSARDAVNAACEYQKLLRGESHAKSILDQIRSRAFAGWFEVSVDPDLMTERTEGELKTLGYSVERYVLFGEPRVKVYWTRS